MTDTKKPPSGPRPQRRRGRGAPSPEAQSPRRHRDEPFREREEWVDPKGAEPRYVAPEEVDYEDDVHPDVHLEDEIVEEPYHDEPRTAVPRDGQKRRDRGGRPEPEPDARPGDEYTLQVGYDRAARMFVASYGEISEIRVQRASRDAAVREAELKLDQHLEALHKKKAPMPEPWLNGRLPDAIDLKLSQGLMKKLHACARLERVSLEQLVTEFVSAGLERRNEPARGNERQPPQGRRESGGGGRGGGGGQGGGNRRQQNHRNFQNTMDSRENFMEYVRNLEKGGGYPKKR